ncbi:MAG: D-alanine--D-alanine ligase [Candidatus Omnitrophota bacterium]
MGIKEIFEDILYNDKHKLGRIGILMGGPSTERQISLNSGQAVYESLKQSGCDVIAIDIKTDDIEENIDFLKSCRINCAFIALHGYFGEDGQIQEILENLNIPYTGSGIMASRLAMDKVSSRMIFEICGLNAPKYKVIDNSFIQMQYYWDVSKEFRFPIVVKPVTHGSSVGLSIVDKKDDFIKAVELAFNFDKKVIVEEYIEGREVTVGVLNNDALPVIEIIPKSRFFDYQAKYETGLTEYIVPAKLDKKIIRELQQKALMAHKALGCFSFSRVDMILKKNNFSVILEVNTIPGLTKNSLLPKAAKAAGIDFSHLCLKLIRMAYEKAKQKQAL